MRMTVADLMCETPVTIRPECSTDDALEAFYEFETTELFVVDKSGCLRGVLPDYELLKAEISGEARKIRVEQLMSRTVATVSPDTDAAEVARLFRASYCSQLPVLKGRRLVGVVTRSDVLRLMAVFRRLERETKPNPAGLKKPRILKHLTSDTVKPVTARSTASSQRTIKRRSRTSSQTSATR